METKNAKGPTASPSEALLVLARLRHDLAKYIYFSSRWLGPDAGTDERLCSLREDLLETRRGPEGVEDGWTVWEGYLPLLTGRAELSSGSRVDLSHNAEFSDLQQTMLRVKTLIEALRSGQPMTEHDVNEGIDVCKSVSEAVRALHESLVEGADHG